ncbi:hypothetical protein AFM16_37555 [Streptomyces antibioticus]|uniref:Uncharacterized protein n=1 Tax=Streptomyces antibioticus TaxID=1890 RepID=A0ABX3LD63_STRAT|nr:hypothetical protein AFM16_37555 [Streptomyces antibioticus]
MAARCELVEQSYPKEVGAAPPTPMTGLEEAHRLCVQPGKEPLPAEQRIDWTAKPAWVRAVAPADVSTPQPMEALVPRD